MPALEYSPIHAKIRQVQSELYNTTDLAYLLSDGLLEYVLLWFQDGICSIPQPPLH
nr:MAG TPA: hypothetical protein [Inoviridae sp.]